MVSTSSLSQFSLEALVGVRVELPGRHTCSDLEVSQEPVYQVERILKWRKVPRGRHGEKEVLVTWTGYPLEETQLINEKNFTGPTGFKKQMKQDRPVEETNKPQPSTSASLALRT